MNNAIFEPSLAAFKEIKSAIFFHFGNFASCKSVVPGLINIWMDNLEATVPFMLRSCDLWHTKTYAKFGPIYLVSKHILYKYSIPKIQVVHLNFLGAIDLQLKFCLQNMQFSIK